MSQRVDLRFRYFSSVKIFRSLKINLALFLLHISFIDFRCYLFNQCLFCIAIQREEEKVKRSLKEAAKKGDKDVCKILAKEIIRARKACNKIYTSKAHLNSVSLQMKNQLATIRVAGSVSKSTEVMQAMQSLVRVPEVAATMREMSKEMMKAGIIEEMLDETMDSIEDSEDMEDEADEEVDKVDH